MERNKKTVKFPKFPNRGNNQWWRDRPSRSVFPSQHENSGVSYGSIVLTVGEFASFQATSEFLCALLDSSAQFISITTILINISALTIACSLVHDNVYVHNDQLSWISCRNIYDGIHIDWWQIFWIHPGIIVLHIDRIWTYIGWIHRNITLTILRDILKNTFCWFHIWFHFDLCFFSLYNACKILTFCWLFICL